MLRFVSAILLVSLLSLGWAVVKKMQARTTLGKPHKVLRVHTSEGSYELHLNTRGRVSYREFRPSRYVSEAPVEGIPGTPPIEIETSISDQGEVRWYFARSHKTKLVIAPDGEEVFRKSWPLEGAAPETPEFDDGDDGWGDEPGEDEPPIEPLPGETPPEPTSEPFAEDPDSMGFETELFDESGGGFESSPDSSPSDSDMAGEDGGTPASDLSLPPPETLLSRNQSGDKVVEWWETPTHKIKRVFQGETKTFEQAYAKKLPDPPSEDSASEEPEPAPESSGFEDQDPDDSTEPSEPSSEAGDFEEAPGESPWGEANPTPDVDPPENFEESWETDPGPEDPTSEPEDFEEPAPEPEQDPAPVEEAPVEPFSESSEAGDWGSDSGFDSDPSPPTPEPSDPGFDSEPDFGSEAPGFDSEPTGFEGPDEGSFETEEASPSDPERIEPESTPEAPDEIPADPSPALGFDEDAFSEPTPDPEPESQDPPESPAVMISKTVTGNRVVKWFETNLRKVKVIYEDGQEVFKQEYLKKAPSSAPQDPPPAEPDPIPEPEPAPAAEAVPESPAILPQDAYDPSRDVEPDPLGAQDDPSGELFESGPNDLDEPEDAGQEPSQALPDLDPALSLDPDASDEPAPESSSPPSTKVEWVETADELIKIVRDPSTGEVLYESRFPK